MHLEAYLIKKRLKSISLKNDLFFSTKFIIILLITLFGLLKSISLPFLSNLIFFLFKFSFEIFISFGFEFNNKLSFSS